MPKDRPKGEASKRTPAGAAKRTPDAAKRTPDDAAKRTPDTAKRTPDTAAAKVKDAVKKLLPGAAASPQDARGSSEASTEARPAPAGAPPAGHDLADNSVYVPGHGDDRYRVRSYDLDLVLKLAGNHLEGRATLVAVPLVPRLERFALDLHGLKVASVTVDGKAAKFTHRAGRLHVTPRRPLTPAASFSVSVKYAGNPRGIRGLDGVAGWEELDDGLLVASQPHGAPSWYPCNDQPGDKASYRFEITTDSDYQVVANGSLLSTRRRSSRTTWIYDQPEPMAPYLATLQVGRYATHDVPDAGVPTRLHFPPELRRDVLAGPMTKHGRMLAAFVDAYGPYPFGRYDAVITADVLEIPLEAQGLSIFGAQFVESGWEQERLVAHELAHQWFGNSLTASHWRDIWLHEGFACFSEWLWSERSGGPSAATHARRQHRALAGKAKDLLLADPGPDLMFDDRVYKRGACTVQALRETIGDDAFFPLLQQWCALHRHGVVTTPVFVDFVATRTGLDPTWFDPWLWERRLPPMP